MNPAADLHAARAQHEAWQRADDDSSHDRDPRRVRVMRIVAAERVRMIEHALAGQAPAHGRAPAELEAA